MERLFDLFIRMFLPVQSIGAKKSKIVNKLSSKLKVLKMDGVKLVLVVK
jgi:hypothetical protein